MGDGEEDEEPKYKLFTADSEAPRENGSQNYSGLGKAQYLNGDTYNGSYVEGFRKGKGTYVWKKYGDSYDGEWGGQGLEKNLHQDNKKHGFGKMTYRNLGGEEEEEGGDDDSQKIPRGGTYLGWYHNGARGCADDVEPKDSKQCEGTFTYVNGDIYVGEWRKGKKHGKGTYFYAKDGSKLVGDWVEGKMQVGKWMFPNGTFYSGQFKYNKPDGVGVWVFPNGNQILGKYTQKKISADEEGGGGGEDEENPEAKPDPKVWCNFKCGESRVVHGGTMFPPKVEVLPCAMCGMEPCRYA